MGVGDGGKVGSGGVFTVGSDEDVDVGLDGDGDGTSGWDNGGNSTVGTSSSGDIGDSNGLEDGEEDTSSLASSKGALGDWGSTTTDLGGITWTWQVTGVVGGLSGGRAEGASTVTSGWVETGVDGRATSRQTDIDGQRSLSDNELEGWVSIG